jgi:hypothetical protein
MKNGSINWMRLVFIILFLLSVGLNIWLLYSRGKDGGVSEVIKTVYVTDTIRDTVPDVRYEKLVCHVRDTLYRVDTIAGEVVEVPVAVDVPISQKEYGDDSTYRAWVSGYRPNLDSIEVYRKNVYTEKVITKVKRPHIVVGPQVGCGYDFTSNKFGLFIGVGVTYNLWGF